MVNDPADQPVKPEEYRDYLMFLARMGFRRRRGVWSASDVVNETLLKAYEARYPCRGDVQAWLRQILRNVICDRYREKGWYREVGVAGGSVDRSATWMGTFVASQTSPSKAIIAKEGSLRLSQALLKLPDDQFDAVCLKHVLRMPLSKAAEEMKRSRASVAGLIRRALQELRRDLKESA